MADGEPTELFIDALEDSIINQQEKDFSTVQGERAKKLVKRLKVLQERVIIYLTLDLTLMHNYFFRII